MYTYNIWFKGSKYEKSIMKAEVYLLRILFLG